MTTTTLGSGVEPVAEAPVEAPTAESTPANLPPDMDELLSRPMDARIAEAIEVVRASMRHEMDAAVADIERRYAQAREMEQAAFSGIPRQQVHAEDLNIAKHIIEGYTVTANSPTAGSIAWSSLNVVYLGVDYTIANGNTANKYAWFIKPASGTTATLQTGNTLPTLGPNDALIWVNQNGTPISALETSVTYAVGTGVVGAPQLASDVSTILSNLQASDIALQAAIDGAIETYYQNDPPWPAGSPSPGGGNINMGDMWYDANDGGAFRWTGATPASGVTANTWQKVADTDNSALEGKINTKTTTYLANNGTPPTAPAGGFTTGDLWMVIDQGNQLRRWSGSAWTTLQIGDGAISGIAGAKVGSGINGSNITTGTVQGTLVGTGINATNVTSGTLAGARVGSGVSPANLTGSGTAPVNAIPQLNAAKLNTSFHMLY